jgi:transcriptional regulator of acetoin/glycerol metabolism
VESTVQAPAEANARTAPPGWVLVVAHHADARLVGVTRVVEAGVTLALGRGQAALGPGVLDDGTLSREHAQIAATADSLRVRDLGSRNGTWVNGVRVDDAVLAAGDVIELGAALVQVLRPAQAPRLVAEAGLHAVSGAMAAILDELHRLAPLDTTVTLVGETGSGKSALARALHSWRGRGPFVILPCAALTPELAPSELHGVATAAYRGAVERAGQLAAADGGTLVLDAVDDAPPAVQAALRSFLDDLTVRPVGGGAARRLDVRVVAIARGVGRVAPELASRLERSVVRVPPLRERAEDIGVLARAAFARAGRTPSKRLALAMLRYAWPHNVAELEAVVERAVVDAGDDDPVPLSPPIAARLGVTEATPSSSALTIARDGSWMRTAGREVVSLRRRENLGLLLRALAQARRDRPGRALSIEDLFRAGWPDQRIDAKAAAGRVYVALTSLRNLGLRDVLTRNDDGYLLDPGAEVELSD